MAFFIPQTGVVQNASQPIASKPVTIGSLQDAIRALPDCIGGQSIAGYLTAIGIAARSKARELAMGGSFDFGEGTKIYSAKRIMDSADALDAYGKLLAASGKAYCRASAERNRVIIMLGDLFGLVGARLGVNTTIAAAQEEFVEEVGERAKKAVEGTSVVLIVVAVIALIIVLK